MEEPAAASPSVTAFDREWALTILESALARLQAEYAQAQAEHRFEIWKKFLPGATDTCSYEAAAAQLGATVPAFKSDIHRLRRRLRALVRGEIARTVSAPHEIESEMAHLQRVLMDRGSEIGEKDAKLPGPNP